jgi:lipopolysaccharide transport system ATP-binding protein
MFDLEFNSVSKRYRIRNAETAGPSGSGLFGKIRSYLQPKAEFWAVRDVDFRVSQGEALGIIGHNGAGKSTVLKLLSNITTPTMGEINIRGRIAALLEVGSGFHPELTGRENVFLSGSILGMRRSEISIKLESILDFAGLKKFADVPVKRYSSGMYVRLGFSIAAHLDADILLLDEVLAVGDAKFQERCQQRILELKAAGKTIVFISHDLSAVRQLCDRALLLNHGQLIYEGTPPDAIAEYSRLGRERSRGEQDALLNSGKPAWVTNLAFIDEHGNPTTEVRTGHPVRIIVEYEANTTVSNAAITVLFYSSGDWTVASHFTTSGTLLQLREGVGSIEFTADELSLGPGSYAASCTIEDQNEEIDFVSKTYFSVAPGATIRGRYHSPHKWRELNRSELSLSDRDCSDTVVKT